MLLPPYIFANCYRGIRQFEMTLPKNRIRIFSMAQAYAMLNVGYTCSRLDLRRHHRRFNCIAIPAEVILWHGSERFTTIFSERSLHFLRVLRFGVSHYLAHIGARVNALQNLEFFKAIFINGYMPITFKKDHLCLIFPSLVYCRYI
ncbi:hypothetical protein ABKN59_006337 [Abortiporus biennis]